MEEKDVRVARGPEVRAIGSEGVTWVWLGKTTTLFQPQCSCGAFWKMETWMLHHDQGHGCGGLPLGETMVWGVKRTRQGKHNTS